MIEVEIWSDVVCPFCYIGKRNFERAVEKLGKTGEVKVTYRSFELDPGAPKSQKISINEVLAKKYGRSLEWAKQMNENVTATAAQSRLSFHMDKVIPSNSFDAHRLAHLALANGKQIEAEEALFKAYFTDGKDIASHDVLLAIAKEIGLAEDETKRMLSGSDYETKVREDERMAEELDVRGVPFFVFNGKFAVSGAQPVELFEQVLEEPELEK